VYDNNEQLYIVLLTHTHTLMKLAYLYLLFFVILHHTVTAQSGTDKLSRHAMKIQVWHVSDTFKYPEATIMSDFNDRPNVGICFSGGGTRSASATLGQLRALDSLGLLNKVRYISAVSGGAWTAMPFSYLPSEFNDNTFFGKYYPASKITMCDLKKVPKGSMARSIKSSYIGWKLIFSIGRVDETFAFVLKNVFLWNFRLSRNKYFTYTEKYLGDNVLPGNRNVIDTCDFYVFRDAPNRPYLIVNGTVNPYEKDDAYSKTIMHFEITPVYSGISVKSKNGQVGGVYLQSHGIDHRVAKKEAYGKAGYTWFLDDRKAFDIGDAMAVTGAAPGLWANTHYLDGLGMPELEIWSPEKPYHKGRQPMELQVTDGGNLENLGLIPLLKRGVKRIIVFVNSPTPLETSDEFKYSKAPSDLKVLFGRRHEWQDVQVLEDCGKFNQLIDTLVSRKRRDTSLVYIDTYRVANNPLLGVDSRLLPEVEIMWVFLDRDQSWENNLSPKVKKKLDKGRFNAGIFSRHKGRFPNYNTFFTGRSFGLIKLSKKQVNLLSQYTSFTVMNEQQVFRDFVNGK
jgi:hypothetical protein